MGKAYMSPIKNFELKRSVLRPPHSVRPKGVIIWLLKSWFMILFRISGASVFWKEVLYKNGGPAFYKRRLRPMIMEILTISLTLKCRVGYIIKRMKIYYGKRCVMRCWDIKQMKYKRSWSSNCYFSNKESFIFYTKIASMFWKLGVSWSWCKSTLETRICLMRCTEQFWQRQMQVLDT